MVPLTVLHMTFSLHLDYTYFSTFTFPNALIIHTKHFRKTHNGDLLWPYFPTLGVGVEGEEGEGEGGSSDEDDDEGSIPDIICDDGDHKWTHNICMICTLCGYCTGYGFGCCNEGELGRESGQYVIHAMNVQF